MVYFISMCADEHEQNRAEEIYKEGRKAIYFTVKHMFSNPADIEDAVQNAFVAVVKNIKHIMTKEARGELKLKAYLSKIAYNENVSEMRKKGRAIKSEALTEREGSHISDPEFELDKDMLARICSRDMVGRLVSELDEKYRRVIFWKYWMDLKDREIAEIEHITIDSVKHRHKHAIRKLRERAEVTCNV